MTVECLNTSKIKSKSSCKKKKKKKPGIAVFNFRSDFLIAKSPNYADTNSNPWIPAKDQEVF